jgi:hypothetical protein
MNSLAFQREDIECPITLTEKVIVVNVDLTQNREN